MKSDSTHHTSTLSNSLIFEHIPNLIFEAGNEFRRFEMVTHRYNGLNVEKVAYYPPPLPRLPISGSLKSQPVLYF